MSNTLKKGLTSQKKNELNEKLNVNKLSSIPMEKYSLYLFPDSRVFFDGVSCDPNQLKQRTIDLIKSTFNIDFEIDVRFSADDIEFYPLGNNYSCQIIEYNDLIRIL